MASPSLKLTGWKKMRALLDVKVTGKALEDATRVATHHNAAIVAAEIRKRITEKQYVKNAALVIALKGADSPLVGDDALLFKAITTAKLTAAVAFVGVKRANAAFNIAETLHEGAVIQVTPKMRGLFQYLFWATQRKNPEGILTGRALEIYRSAKDKTFYPLKDTTTTIILPARPFLREVFEDKALLAKLVKNWSEAVESVIKKATS